MSRGSLPHAFLAALFLCLLGAAELRAQLVEESGSFRAFIGGSEPACAYDNWVGRVSEGIARPGYNVYAPTALDPQTTGFGSFEVLEDDAHGDAILSLFADLADSLLRDRPEGALARLDQIPDNDYGIAPAGSTSPVCPPCVKPVIATFSECFGHG